MVVVYGFVYSQLKLVNHVVQQIVLVLHVVRNNSIPPNLSPLSLFFAIKYSKL